MIQRACLLKSGDFTQNPHRGRVESVIEILRQLLDYVGIIGALYSSEERDAPTE